MAKIWKSSLIIYFIFYHFCWRHPKMVVNGMFKLFVMMNLLSSIYIRQTNCIYVLTDVPLSCANRLTNLHQILHRPPRQLREGSQHKFDPVNLTPGYPKLQNLNRSLEKNFALKKCPDGWSDLIKFFPSSAGPKLAIITYILGYFYLYI